MWVADMRSEDDSGFDQQAGLARVGPCGAKGKPGRAAACLHVGQFGAPEELFVLVRRGDRQGPRIAPGAVEQGRIASIAVGADVLDPARQAVSAVKCVGRVQGTSEGIEAMRGTQLGVGGNGRVLQGRTIVQGPEVCV